MEFYLLTAATFFGGIYFVIRNILMLKNDDRLVAYLETSPTGKAWVKKFGMEETMNKSKKLFLPLGCIMGGVLFVVGSRNLFIIVSQL